MPSRPAWENSRQVSDIVCSTALLFFRVAFAPAGDAACLNKLTGYYYWLFLVGSGGSVGNPLNEIAVDWHRDAVDESVIEWNNDASGLSKNSFPAFTRMP